MIRDVLEGAAVLGTMIALILAVAIWAQILGVVPY
jgi:hypothetical protein